MESHSKTYEQFCHVKGKNIEVFTVSLEEVERVLDLSV